MPFNLSDWSEPISVAQRVSSADVAWLENAVEVGMITVREARQLMQGVVMDPAIPIQASMVVDPDAGIVAQLRLLTPWQTWVATREGEFWLFVNFVTLEQGYRHAYVAKERGGKTVEIPVASIIDVVE
jgi:hypothetical protein